MAEYAQYTREYELYFVKRPSSHRFDNSILVPCFGIKPPQTVPGVLGTWIYIYFSFFPRIPFPSFFALLFLSMYLTCWRAYVVPVISSTVAYCSVFFYPFTALQCTMVHLAVSPRRIFVATALFFTLNRSFYPWTVELV